jgi:hypothetical protein
MTSECDQHEGCAVVRVQSAENKERDRRLGENEKSIDGIHRRIDALMLLALGSMGSSLVAAVLAYIAANK